MKLSRLFILVLLFFGLYGAANSQKKKEAPAPPATKNAAKKAKTSNKTVKSQIKKSKNKNAPVSEKPAFKTVNDKQYFVINNKWFSKESGTYTLVDKPVEVSKNGKAVKKEALKKDTSEAQNAEPKIKDNSWTNTPLEINYNNRQYHFFAGHWFLKENGNYKNTKAPVGAELPFLPQEASKVEKNGKIHFKYRGVQYAKTAQGTYVVVE